MLKNAREGLAREIVESIYDKGIGEIYIGYPKGIAQDKGNKRNTNFWSYSSIIQRIKDVAQEYGIKVKLVDEENTSKTRSLCGEMHENGRIKRGLFKCPHTGKVINADLKNECSGRDLNPRSTARKAVMLDRATPPELILVSIHILFNHYFQII